MEGQQRHNAQRHKGHNANHRAHVKILVVNGQLVQPGNEQVRGARGGFHRPGHTLGSEENHVEIVDVSGEGGDEVGSGHKQHVRQGDIKERHHRACAVHSGRLIQLCGDILQDARDLQQHIGHAHPDVNEYHRHPRPGGIVKERQRRLNPP